MFTPKQGDIISLSFEPSAGKEIIKRRPAYVLSSFRFNEATGFAIVAPVTSSIRGVALEVVLPSQMATHGSVLVHQLRSLDFAARKARFIEESPLSVQKQVAEIAKLLISS